MGRGLYLKAGDVIFTSIDEIGTIANTVTAEK
jgi:2-keto-4-pentenoate hydratase/2-oxohepta-3-ene-1,7-dioic acid hydratase in catechol pathway